MDTDEIPEDASRYYRIETHVPDLAVRIVLTLLPAVREYSYPTRMEEDGWGFTIIHHASPLPS
jgi:hypothetical protein